MGDYRGNHRTRWKLNPAKTCRCPSQKNGYRTKADADREAEIMMDAGKVKRGCHLTAFLCRDCREWHVGNRRIVWPDETRST